MALRTNRKFRQFDALMQPPVSLPGVRPALFWKCAHALLLLSNSLQSDLSLEHRIIHSSLAKSPTEHKTRPNASGLRALARSGTRGKAITSAYTPQPYQPCPPTVLGSRRVGVLVAEDGVVGAGEVYHCLPIVPQMRLRAHLPHEERTSGAMRTPRSAPKTSARERSIRAVLQFLVANSW